VAVPIAALIFAVTVVGLPVSRISLEIWGTSLYVAYILVTAFLGPSLVRSPEGAKPSFALPLLVGLLIVKVATSAPYIGGWLSFLVLTPGPGHGGDAGLRTLARVPAGLVGTSLPFSQRGENPNLCPPSRRGIL
jgi:hypothetical protein